MSTSSATASSASRRTRRTTPTTDTASGRSTCASGSSGFEWVDGEKASPSSKDRTAFPAFYGAGGRRQPAEGGRAGQVGKTAQVFTCTGPIAYTRQELVARDIAHLQAALDGAAPAGAFLPAVSPGSLPSLIPDRHHADEDAYRQALAGALREEYLAIADAGLTLQIDDPVLVAAWDFWPDDDLDAYRAVARRDVELLNEALRGIPTEQIRYHLCWGSWQGPHRSDLPLADVLDLMLEIRAGAYLVEAANAQHEHEWKLWRDTALPDGATLIPGVVTHKTSVVEHPEVVADRIVRYAELVGPERVMAGTDCGLGGRISSDVAWAKLDDPRGGRATGERTTGGPMTDRILTTHTGSLPRPPGLVEALGLAGDGAADEATQERLLQEAVAGVVARQVDAGVDVVSDGEQSKAGYSTYVTERLTGFGGRGTPLRGAAGHHSTSPSGASRSWRASRRRSRRPRASATSPIAEPALVERDIANLRRALDAHPGAEGFMTTASPGVISLFLENQHYTTHEDYLGALAAAMRTEYEALHASGMLLQIDCPDLAVGRHVQFPDMPLEEWKRTIELHVEALNDATRNIPPEAMRMHLCWGNYEGPHNHDVPLAEILPIVLQRPSGADLLRAREPTARARVARLRGRRPAGRQGPRPGRHRLDDELHRAPGPRRRAHRQARAARRARARHREHRLRLRDVRRVRARVPVDRLREARRPRGGRRARERGALG